MGDTKKKFKVGFKDCEKSVVNSREQKIFQNLTGHSFTNFDWVDFLQLALKEVEYKWI